MSIETKIIDELNFMILSKKIEIDSYGLGELKQKVEMIEQYIK